MAWPKIKIDSEMMSQIKGCSWRQTMVQVHPPIQEVPRLRVAGSQEGVPRKAHPVRDLFFMLFLLIYS